MHERRRDVPQEQRLQRREPSRAGHDQPGVALIGDVEDRPPDRSYTAFEPPIHGGEAGVAGQLDAVLDRAVGALERHRLEFDDLRSTPSLDAPERVGSEVVAGRLPHVQQNRRRLPDELVRRCDRVFADAEPS